MRLLRRAFSSIFSRWAVPVGFLKNVNPCSECGSHTCHLPFLHLPRVPCFAGTTLGSAQSILWSIWSTTIVVITCRRRIWSCWDVVTHDETTIPTRAERTWTWSSTSWMVLCNNYFSTRTEGKTIRSLIWLVNAKGCAIFFKVRILTFKLLFWSIEGLTCKGSDLEIKLITRSKECRKGIFKGSATAGTREYQRFGSVDVVSQS